MNRKAFFASIFGALGVAKAQCITTDPRGCAVGHGTADWEIGKALNNQCPQCRTMAEPYKRPMYDAYFGMCHGTGNADGTVTCAPPKMKVDPNSPIAQVARCKRCNAAFWQDAE